MKTYTYVSIGPARAFTNEATRAGFLNENDSCVLEADQFWKFLNMGVLTTPVFVSSDYQTCLEVARQLTITASMARHGLLDDEA